MVRAFLELSLVAAAAGLAAAAPPSQWPTKAPPMARAHDTTVLILGGGVAGVLAARTLHEKGIDRFLIVEAREELGGRMRSTPFGEGGRRATVELGANWIQGTQEGNGPANPILTLAQKHGLKTAESDFYTSIGKYRCLS
jgi:polyamine oxidase